MSKFLLKWIFLISTAYLAYKNRRRLLHSLFGIQPLRSLTEMKWTERFMDRFMYERS